MDVNFIFRVAGVGMIVAVLNQVLVNSGREEQGILTTVAGIIVVILMIVNELGDLFSTMKTIFGF